MATVRECDLCMLATDYCTSEHCSCIVPLSSFTLCSRPPTDLYNVGVCAAEDQVIRSVRWRSLNMHNDTWNENNQSMPEALTDLSHPLQSGELERGCQTRLWLQTVCPCIGYHHLTSQQATWG